MKIIIKSLPGVFGRFNNIIINPFPLINYENINENKIRINPQTLCPRGNLLLTSVRVLPAKKKKCIHVGRNVLLYVSINR